MYGVARSVIRSDLASRQFCTVLFSVYKVLGEWVDDLMACITRPGECNFIYEGKGYWVLGVGGVGRVME